MEGSDDELEVDIVHFIKMTRCRSPGVLGVLNVMFYSKNVRFLAHRVRSMYHYISKSSNHTFPPSQHQSGVACMNVSSRGECVKQHFRTFCMECG